MNDAKLAVDVGTTHVCFVSATGNKQVAEILAVEPEGAGTPERIYLKNYVRLDGLLLGWVASGVYVTVITKQ
jgi:hypothetical protein